MNRNCAHHSVLLKKGGGAVTLLYVSSYSVAD